MDRHGWTSKKTTEVTASDVTRIASEGNAVDYRRWAENLRRRLETAQGPEKARLEAALAAVEAGLTK
jgi:hypothetical protein